MFDFIKKMFGTKEEVEKASAVDWYLPGFPVSGFTGVSFGQYGETIPIPPMDFSLLYDLALNSAEVYSPINALIRETLRSGVQIVPQYRWKCLVSGVEYDDKTEALKYCPEDQLVSPNEQEYMILEKWRNKINDYGDTLRDLLQGFLFDLNVLDNAYLVAIYKYEFDDKGEVIGQELQQIIRADPRFMRIIMNKRGMLGTTNDGNKVYFCPNDRENPIEVEPDKEPPTCPAGLKPFPAHFVFIKPGDYTGRVYYAPWEVLHVKKFFQGAGYGRSPLFGVLYKILALMYMDRFIYKAFQKDRPPRGLLILRGNFESIWKAWEKLLDSTRDNPHAVYPIIIEDLDIKGDVAKWIDLELSPKEFDMIELRRELRRVISAVYGVSPVFYDTNLRPGEATSGFIVVNRAVEYEQRILNEKVLPWITKRIGVTSYTYALVPPEIRDRKTELEIKKRIVDIVATLRRIGFDARLRETDDGSWDIEIVSDPNPEMLGEATDRALRGLRTTLKQGTKENPEQARERELNRYYEEEPGNQPGTRQRVEDQRFKGEPELKNKEGGEGQ